ncbi:hypothetical protein HN873_039332 [Arachis hypogaea]
MEIDELLLLYRPCKCSASEGDPSSSAAQAIGLIAAGKELQGLKALNLNKLLRDSENFTIQYYTKNGLLLKIVS